MTDRFLIDECLSASLVAAAKARGYDEGHHQIALFEKALEAFAVMNDDLTNKVMEVLADGSVHVRDWNADQHDIGHISKPGWP